MEVETVIRGELLSAFVAWGNSSLVLPAAPYKDLGRARLVFNDSVLCVHVCELSVQSCPSGKHQPAHPTGLAIEWVVFYLGPFMWP